MILVSGAGGKTGQAVVAGLVEAGLEVRGWYRRPFDRLREQASEVFVGDMEEITDWERALVGVEKVYHICPNMHENEFGIGEVAIDSAKKAGVSHFVYHSVLHPQTAEMPHHWQKLRVEEYLFQSGLDFTIVQPTAYMQNLLPQIEVAKETGVFSQPYSAETRISLIDLADLAKAAVKIMQGDRFKGATLELAGTEPLSQLDVLEMIREEVGREIVFHQIPIPEWEANNQHLPTYARESLIKMFRYYDTYGLVGNPYVLQQILGDC